MKKPLNKKKLWIIIAIALAVVIAAAATVTVLLLNRDTVDTGAGVSDSKIYWNLNRLSYFGNGDSGFTSREKDRMDGYYHILFSVDGRPTERKIKTLKLATKIDDYDAMGLVVDEKTREVTDIKTIEELGATFLFKNLYVSEVNPEKFEVTLRSTAMLLGKEVKLKVKSTTPIYDCSSIAGPDAGMPVKFESINKKDQLSVIIDREENILGVYIVKRDANLRLYWNLERKFDRAYGVTTRVPDKDGVYHILMAMGGAQYDVLCKDKDIVTKMDSVAAMGLEFDDQGYVKEYINYKRITGGGATTSWYTVDSFDEQTYTATKYDRSSLDFGKPKTCTLSPDYEVYNVSKNFEVLQGEASEIKVNDTIHCYTDPAGNVVLVYVVKRFKTGDLYWNTYRKWDNNKKISTRKKEADGYYHFIMCTNGSYKDYKTTSWELVNKIDSIPARTMNLKLSGDVIIDCETASSVYYNSVASWYKVKSYTGKNMIHFKKEDPKAADNGKEYDYELDEDCKIYNVSEFYEDHLGEETTLRPGDTVQCWGDTHFKIKVAYVISRVLTNPQTPHKNTHKCEDCDKSVNWQPWTSGSSLPTTSGHYYLCGDVITKLNSIKNKQDVVLCLNGYSVKCASTRIYATIDKGTRLTILDCVGTGKMYSKYQGDLGTTRGGILWARYGTISLYGGTYIAPEQRLPSGGGVIYGEKNTDIIIKNATVIGGEVAGGGGAIYVTSGSHLFLDNATVKAGKSSVSLGDAVYMGGSSRLYLGGKVQISGSSRNNLYLAKGAYLRFSGETFEKKAYTGGLTEGSIIYVSTATPSGQFANAYKTGAEKYFVSDKAGYSVVPVGTAMYLYSDSAKSAHNNAHIEKYGDEGIEWTPWFSTNSLPTVTGNYYLTADVKLTSQQTIKTEGQNVVLCLDGHNIESTAKRVYGISKKNSNLTIVDCKAKGKIFNSTTNKDAYTVAGNTVAGKTENLPGGLFVIVYGEVNIKDVTLEAPTVKMEFDAPVMLVNTGVIVNFENCTIKGGTTTAQGGALCIRKDAKVTLKDTNIISGKAGDGGDAVKVLSGGTLILSGKVNITEGTKQVYLEDGAYIHLDDALKEGSHISVDIPTKSGFVTDNYTPDAEKYIESTRKNYAIKVEDEKLYLYDTTYVPPAHATEHACKDCGKDVTWKLWDEDDSLPTKAGHYYLGSDVDLTKEQRIAENAEVVLCLNGHTVKSTDTRVYSTYNTGSKLVIDDCQKTGKMVRTGAKSGTDIQGGVLWAKNGSISIYGGEYIAAEQKLPSSGGVIYGEKNTDVFIKDATITGGEVSDCGGAIYITSGAHLFLDNTTVKAGKSGMGMGDAVYMGAGSRLYLGGKVKVSGSDENNLYLANNAFLRFSDKTLSYTGGLTEGSEIHVTTATASGQIANEYKAGAEAYFVSDKAGYTILTTSAAMYLRSNSADLDHSNAHIEKYGDEGIEWTPWLSTNSLPIVTGNYYLTADVKLTSQQTIKTEGQNVVLCLDGHNIESTAKRVYGISKKNSNLTIVDCKAKGKIFNSTTNKDAYTVAGNTVAGKTENLPGGLFVIVYGEVNIKDVTLEAPTVKMEFDAPVMLVNTGVIVNFENCTIKGGTTTAQGGALCIRKDAKVTLKDTNIISGTADNGGDAIKVLSGGTLILSGKVNITEGTKQVYLENGAYIHLDDALKEGSHIGVDTQTASGLITDNYKSGAENYIVSNKEKYAVKVDDSKLYLIFDENAPAVSNPASTTGKKAVSKASGNVSTTTADKTGAKASKNSDTSDNAKSNDKAEKANSSNSTAKANIAVYSPLFNLLREVGIR